jgi:hypothetical protein
MIVLSHPKGWKIINQRSHGLLAEMIAYQYNIDLPNDILVPTLITIAEQDDGAAETRATKNLTKNLIVTENILNKNVINIIY